MSVLEDNCLLTLLSSAKRYIEEYSYYIRDIINYSKNRSGPKILSCGTPDTTGNILDETPSTSTQYILPERSSLSQNHTCRTCHAKHADFIQEFIVGYRVESLSGVQINSISARSLISRFVYFIQQGQ